jgi:hypothetical protein
MVEGKDDEEVVKHLCGYFELGKIEKIHQCDGVNQLLKDFAVRIKESDIATLGVMLDADANVRTRWQSVTKPLKDAGYKDIPTNPEDGGTIIPPPPNNTLLPRVGIWLMPNNREPGILEDFLRSLIPTKDVLLAHAEKSIEEIPPGEKLFSPAKQTKALIHTWLSWQEEPGKPFGLAIKARYLKSGSPVGLAFSKWLKNLFFHDLQETSR